MKRPFLHIFIFYVLGILFHHKFNINIATIKLILLINIFLIVVFFVMQKNKKTIKHMILLSVFLMSIMITENSIDKSQLSKLYDKEVNASGIVKEEISKDEGYEKYVLYLEKIKHKGKTYDIGEKLIYNVYGDTEIDIGDRIVADITIKQVNKNTNPKLFNYKLYLQSNGVFATGSSKEHNIRIVSRGNLNKEEKISIKVKANIELALDRSLKADNSDLLKSIILGDSSFIDEDYINNFRKLGLSHILAVSGLHIGIIFGTIIYLLDLFKIHRRNTMIIATIVIWIYAALIGFPSSVVRASLMLSFLTIGNLSFNRCDSINTLSFAGFLMLLYRPLWIFSVGFQLSFIATFSILILMPNMKQIIKIKNKKLKSAIVLILTAQLGVLPISLYYFNELQTLFLLSNLILTPILTLGLIIGFFIVLASAITIKFSILIGVLGNFILDISNFITQALSKATNLNIWTNSPSYIEIVFYYFAIMILLQIIDIKKMNKNIQRMMYLNFAIIVIYSSILQLNDEMIKVEFIDVGQGDSCLIRLKDKNLLIDTGGNVFGKFDIGENILLPYLRKTGVKAIDGVFISHFDADHCKGLLSLFGEIDLKNIFIGYKSPENPLYNEIIRASKEHDVKIIIVNKGDILKLDSNNNIQVLEPSKNKTSYEGENDNSLILNANLYNREILFTGDIETNGEDRLIKNSKRRNVDILKVPHHGSKTSSKQELINHFDPKTAIVQVGKNNFGHPDQDVLERYYKNGTEVYRNDKLGLITISITKEKIAIEGYLNEKQNFIDYIMDNKYIMIYVFYSSVILLMIKYNKTEYNQL